MKKLIILQIFLTILNLSCKEKDEIVSSNKISISTTPTSLNFDNNEGVKLLSITTNGSSWTASSDQTWCSLSKTTNSTKESTISITVLKNPNETQRTAKLAIIADNNKDTAVVYIIQNAKPLATISTSLKKIESTCQSSSTSIKVSMTGNIWKAYSNQSWCKVSKDTSLELETNISITLDYNTLSTSRNAKLLFVVDNKSDTAIIDVSQTANEILSYKDSIAPNNSGMSSSAKTLAKQMKVGWNLGNSLEVPSGETAWGNAKSTQSFIDSVKAAGINAIRIPCAWDSYIENTKTCKIKDSWLARVKEVVDYCYKNEMYVILNTHWDGGWLENNPSYDKQNYNNLKLKAIWEQISVYFRDYDEHLLFAGTNEVHSSLSTPSTENIEVQLSYNQTFVDAVRSTGGKNAYRNIIIQAYNTNIDLAVSKLKISTDKISDRMFVEIHYYDPWDFCGLEADATWASVKYFWGAQFLQYGKIDNLTGRSCTWGQEDFVTSQFKKMKTNFVDKGYPVILGEFAPTRRSSLTGETLTHHLESRAYYVQYITTQAKNNGIVPFYWDNGGLGNNACGIFDRTTGSVGDKLILTNLISGSNNGIYPF